VQGFQGEFDALRGDSSSPNPAYITFAGGGGTLSFTHEIDSAASLELVLDLHTTGQTLETTESNFDLTVSYIEYNWNFNTERDFNEITDDSSTRAYDSSFTSSVSWTVGDEVCCTLALRPPSLQTHFLPPLSSLHTALSHQLTIRLPAPLLSLPSPPLCRDTPPARIRCS
jgi:hypothetical protein